MEKPHFAMAIGAAMAAGTRFAHWRVGRQCRVVYFDGEMARDLMRERIADLAGRMPTREFLERLHIISQEDYPALEPLNTDRGRRWALDTLDAIEAASGKIDLVIFDNRMSLLSGDMKEEEPWTQTMPFVRTLTARRIAQLWIDHTGHDTKRIYGSKVKEWTADVVAHLSAVKKPNYDLALKIEFNKARRKRPENRADFTSVTLLLCGKEWSVEGAASPRGLSSDSQPMRVYEALKDAIRTSPISGQTTRDGLYRACTKAGLVERIEESDNSIDKDKKRARLRKSLNSLLKEDLIEERYGVIRDKGSTVWGSN